MRLGRQKYCIIDGKKRWMAAIIAKQARIPVTTVNVRQENTDKVWLDEYYRQPMLPIVDQALTLCDFVQMDHPRHKKKEIAKLLGWRPARVSVLITVGIFLRKALLKQLLHYSQVAGADLPLKLLYAVARCAKLAGNYDDAVASLFEASEPGAKPSAMYEAVCNDLYTQKAQSQRQKDGQTGAGSRTEKAANDSGGRGRTDRQATERDVAKATLELLMKPGPLDLTDFDLIPGTETPSGTPEAPGSGTRQRPPGATGRALLQQLRSMAKIVAWIEGSRIDGIAVTEADAKKIRSAANDLMQKFELAMSKIDELQRI
jgi:hypothetical protein